MAATKETGWITLVRSETEAAPAQREQAWNDHCLEGVMALMAEEVIIDKEAQRAIDRRQLEWRSQVPSCRGRPGIRLSPSPMTRV